MNINNPLKSDEWERVFDAIRYHYDMCDAEEDDINAEIESKLRASVEAGNTVFENVLTPNEWERVFEATHYHYEMCVPDEHEINCDILDKLRPSVEAAQ